MFYNKLESSPPTPLILNFQQVLLNTVSLFFLPVLAWQGGHKAR